MTLPRNGLSGVEKTAVATVWKKSMAESGSRGQGKRIVITVSSNISDFDWFSLKTFFSPQAEGQSLHVDLELQSTQ